MRYAKNYTFLFRCNRFVCCPSKDFKQPSAKFSPHNIVLLKIYIFQLLS